MLKLLILLFIFVPLIEIYLLIYIGSEIGTMPTIILILITAVMGAVLLKYQGWFVWFKIKQNLMQGRLPATSLLEGLILCITGVFLLTPGFFTDAIGFFCMLPSIRSYFALLILRKLTVTQHQGVHRYDPAWKNTIDADFYEKK